MKNKETTAYLQDMLQAIQTIRRYTANLDAQRFRQTPMAVDAVIRQLAIIGEAAAHIPPDDRKGEPKIPWEKIVGMRNKLVHAYAEVDEQVVWDAANSDLDALEAGVRRLYQKKRPEG